MSNKNPNPSTRFGGAQANPQNAGGKPKQRPITAELKALLAVPAWRGKKPPPLPAGATNEQKFARMLFIKSLSGDMAAAREVLNRVEGPVPQKLVGKFDQPMPRTFTLKATGAVSPRERDAMEKEKQKGSR